MFGSMNILHIIPSVGELRGGPSTAIFELAKAQAKTGCNVVIATTQDIGRYKVDVSTLGITIKYNDNYVVFFKTVQMGIGFLDKYLVSIGFLTWLSKSVCKYDVVHIHGIFSFLPIVGMLVCRLQKIPYVVRPLGMLQIWSLNQNKFFKQISLAVIEKSLVRTASAVHFTSDIEYRETLKVVDVATPVVLPLGAATVKEDCLSKEPTIGKIQRTAKVRLLYMSRLHPKKQVDKLIEALAYIKYKYPCHLWSLDIAGSGEKSYVHYLQDLAKKSNIQSNIFWHGFASGTRKEYLIKSADWLILPSSSENFGIIVAEAMLLGCPAIISEEVGIIEYIPSIYYRSIVTGFRIEEFSEVLLEAMNSRLSSLQRIELARYAKEVFDWDSIARGLMEVYSEINNKL